MVAAALLAVVWITIWFYVNLLQEAFLDGLSKPETTGIVLEENTAIRIATHFAGLLSIGVTFPLMSGSALLMGWLSKSRLSFRNMLLPSALFILVSGVLNNWSTVAATGLPPIYDIVKTILGSPTRAITTLEIILLWLLSAALIPVAASLLAAFGWIWSAIGYRFRRVFNGDA